MAVIDLQYRCRDQFAPLHKRRQRWACVVSHIRAGKTVACVMDLIDAALRCDKPEPRFAYVAPHYVQAKDVAWNYVKRFTEALPDRRINEAELYVEFGKGARVRLYGADNYDRMRGIYLDGVVLDEFADFHPSAWPEVIRGRLSDRQGWATFIGTPKGRNSFFEIWDAAQGNPEWCTLQLRASETGILPESELLEARKAMTPEQYAQEYECSFDAAIVGSYYGKEIANAEAEGRVGVVPYDDQIPVHTAWDLGMGDSTAIWCFQIGPDGLRVIDFYENHGQTISHYVGELKSRPYKWGTDWLPHDALVRSYQTGRTRLETVLALGRTAQIVPQHNLMDGVNGARVSFPKIRIDAAKCKMGLEALRQYRAEYDEKARVFKNNPKHDWTSHAADAWRYMCMAWRELYQPKPKPELKKVEHKQWTLDEIVAEHKKKHKSDTKRI